MSFRSSLSILLVCALLGGAAFYSAGKYQWGTQGEEGIANVASADTLGQMAPAAGETAAAVEKAIEKEKPSVAEEKDKKTEDMAGDAEKKPVAEAKTAAEILATHDLQIAYGKEDAPVTVVEYFSLSCPHCGAFYKDDQPKLIQDYVDTGKVRYLKRYFPHNAPGMAAAMLMQCVEEGNKPKFLQALFNMQEKWAFTNDFKKNLQSIAQIGGIGPTDFDACLTNKEIEEKILKQRQEATDGLKIEGIPSLFVNGKKMEGTSYSRLVEVIDAELKAAKE